MWPTWPQVGLPNREKIDAKIDQKIDAFQDRFLSDFGGFWEGTWKQVGTRIDQKSMPVAKGDFLKNRAIPAAGARFFKIRGSKLEAKSDQKSARWDGKSSQDQSKRH